MNPFEKAKAKLEELQRQKNTERQSAAQIAEAANLAFVEKFVPVLDRLEELLAPSKRGLADAGYDPVVDRKKFPVAQVEAALIFTSNAAATSSGAPTKYRITVVVRNNYSSQIGCEMMRADLGDNDQRLVKRYLFRPVALPSFKHEEFEAVFDEKLERIFTKILQSEPQSVSKLESLRLLQPSGQHAQTFRRN